MKALLSILVLTTIMALATAELRQFLPKDIAGFYELFIKQGSCPKSVEIRKVDTLAIGSVYSIPHSKISQSGSACTSDGTFTVLTRRAIAQTGSSMILETGPLGGVISSLESQNTTYMVGFESDERICGTTNTSSNAIALFVEEEKKIQVDGLINLFPGAKYMIVYEPTSPTPCTYFAQSSDRVIGEPTTPEPIPVWLTEDVSMTAEPTEAMETAEVSTSAEDPSVSQEDKGIIGGAAPGSNGGSSENEGSNETEGSGEVESSGETESNGETGGGEGSSTGSSTDNLPIDPGFGVPVVVPSQTSEPFGMEGSPSPEADDGSVCFPADATVELENGEMKRMEELEIGDRVKVAEGKYSDVFMFTHRLEKVKYSFIEIKSDGGNHVRMTQGHYLYVNGEMRAAKTVKAGDLITVDGEMREVVETKRVGGRGLYNPQTVQGDIIVNGVRASTYTTSVEKNAAHSLLAPLRAFFRASGMSCSLLEKGAPSWSSVW